MATGNSFFTVGPILGVECRCGELLVTCANPTGSNKIGGQVACPKEGCRQRWNINGTLMRVVDPSQQGMLRQSVEAGKLAGLAFAEMYDLRAQEVSG